MKGGVKEEQLLDLCGCDGVMGAKCCSCDCDEGSWMEGCEDVKGAGEVRHRRSWRQFGVGREPGAVHVTVLVVVGPSTSVRTAWR